MTKYLISFPASALTATGAELEAIALDTRAVVAEAKAAGAWVFGAALNEEVFPVRISGDGHAEQGAYPEFSELTGGFTILDLPTREDAEHWAARFAAACTCAQELREFHYDPES